MFIFSTENYLKKKITFVYEKSRSTERHSLRRDIISSC